MKRFATVLLAIALTSWVGAATTGLAAQPGQSPARDTAPRRVGTASISGRVLAADTGAPIRRAIVRLAASGAGEARSMMTDGDGKYEFADLSPGTYMLVAQKSGFLTMQLGARQPDDTGKPVKVGEAETVRNADFVMLRGSAISGRVVDEFGDPVAGATVRVTRYRTVVGGLRRPTMVGAATTDDLGHYRVFGLQPGTYYVQAQASMGTDVEVGDHAGYAPTYYPGTADGAAAQAVQIAAGQDVPNIDIMLGVVRTATISGIALDSQGRPASSSNVVAVMSQSSGLASSGYGRVQPDGTFTIRNLPPGDYVVTLTVPNQATQRAEFARAHVPIAGGDVSGISLQASPGATVSGRVIFEGTSSAQTSRFTVTAMSAPSRDSYPGPYASPAQVREDSTFTLVGLFGEHVFRLGGTPGSGALGNWALKAVYLNGRDITDTAMAFDGRETLGGLQIVITDRITHLTVTVNDESGQPADTAFVMVFPDDPARWNATAGSRFQRLGSARSTTPYKTDALPPDDYVAVALPSLPNVDPWDSEFLERMSKSGVRFTLHEGETKALTLKMVEAPR